MRSGTNVELTDELCIQESTRCLWLQYSAQEVHTQKGSTRFPMHVRCIQWGLVIC